MATTAKLYGLGLQSAFSKEINFATDTAKAMLCTSTYVPDQDTHRYKNQVTNEITGTGYTAGGVTLTSKTVTYTAATNVLMLDAADPAWASSTLTARFIVFYIDTGTATTSPLLAYADFGVDITSTASTFTYQIPTTGILTVTAA